MSTQEIENYDYDVGAIYILSGLPDIYKIGKTIHLNKRMYQLRVQLPFRVQLVWSDYTSHMSTVERAIHKELRAQRINGEWFGLTGEQLQYVKDAVMYGYFIPS